MRLVPQRPPPGPFRAEFWRSPLRGPWLTTAIGIFLLAGMVITSLTGFLSHLAYEPDLRGNAIVPPGDDLPTFGWPASPTYLYAINQGLHVNVGLATIPFLLAKLWSVFPRLFSWPPVRSPAHGIERLSIALLVGSSIFQMATGVVNIQYWYVFDFNFVVAHYYGAIVFVASLAIHLVIKFPAMRRAREVHRGMRPMLRQGLDETEPEPLEAEMEEGLVPHDPAAPTTTRRGVLALAGAGSATLLLANVGETIGGPLRPTALLAPRRETGSDFPVNKTFAASRIDREAVSASAWRLELRGPGGASRSLDRAALLGMQQHEERLPIACVEGWTTTQRWSGVRLRDLAAMVGVQEASQVYVVSLQEAILGEGTLDGDTIRQDNSLLALRVNGRDLPLDHGFPARIMVPALPGVRQTKWVTRLEFSA